MKLVVLGAGGHGKVVADCAQASGQFTSIVFLDDAYAHHPGFCGWPVVGKLEDFAGFAEDAEYFVAMGNNQARQTWQDTLHGAGLPLATLVHPKATLGTQVELGAGTLVLAGAVLNILCKTGRGCIINTSASVDHDCQLGNFVHVAPGSRCAGNVTLGDGVFMGIASAAIPGVSIGAHTTVGAGATVVCDIADNLTVVGTPAKVMNKV